MATWHPVQAGALRAIDAYLGEKYQMGLLSYYTWLDTTNISSSERFLLHTTLRTYVEIFCPTLARLMCAGQLQVTVQPTCRIYVTGHRGLVLHMRPNAYHPDTVFGDRDFESILDHLRTRKNTEWRPLR